MLKRILVAILSFFSLFGYAQTSAQAKAVMEKVSAKYKQNPTFYIKYQYQVTSNKGKVLQSSDGMVYCSGTKYNLSLLDTKQIYDGKKLYTITPSQKEIIVTTPDLQNGDLLTPTALLDAYKVGYNLQLVSTNAVVNGKKVQQIKLTPTIAGSKGYIILSIDPATYALVQLKEVSKDGNIVTLTVKEYIKNVILPKETFVFNKSLYKNYIVTDLD